MKTPTVRCLDRVVGTGAALLSLVAGATGQDVPIALHTGVELAAGPEEGDGARPLAAALSFQSGRRFEPIDRPGLVDALVAAWRARATTELESGGLAPGEGVVIEATEERIVILFRASEQGLAPLLGRLVHRLTTPDYAGHEARADGGPGARAERIARWLTAGQLPSAKNERPLTKDDLLAFHRGAIGRLRARLDVLGKPADPDALEAALAAELAELPLGAKQPRIPPPVEFPPIERTTIVVAAADPGARPFVAFQAAWVDEATPLVRSLTARSVAALGFDGLGFESGPHSWTLAGPRDAGDVVATVDAVLARLGKPSEAAARLAEARDAFVAAERERAADPERGWSDRLSAILAATSTVARTAELDALAALDPAALAALVGRVLDPQRTLAVVLAPLDVVPALRALGDTTVLPSRGARGDGLTAVVQLERTLEVLGGRERWAALRGYGEASQVEIRGFDQPVTTRSWRRFDPFAIRMEQESNEGTVVTIAREDAGWTILGEAVSKLMPDQRRTIVQNARGALPHWLNRLAREDELRVRFVDERPARLEVYGRDRFHTLSWLTLGDDGRPTRFGVGMPGAADAQVFELAEWVVVDGLAFAGLRRNEARGLTTRSAFQANGELGGELFEPRVDGER